MTPDEYVRLVAGRLSAGGAQVSTVPMGGTSALVGYRAQFRLRWMATRLNLFTVVIAVSSVTAAGLEQVSSDALGYAVSQKGRLRGLQNGVAAIGVLVGDRVDADAAGYAREKLLRRFSAFTWPVAVDLSAGTIHQHQGRVLVGGLYAGWMRDQIALALPAPRA